jgi:hypothetical protein
MGALACYGELVYIDSSNIEIVLLNFSLAFYLPPNGLHALVV